jgi:hypothetical protein
MRLRLTSAAWAASALLLARPAQCRHNRTNTTLRQSR